MVATVKPFIQAVALGYFQGFVKIFFWGSTFNLYFALAAVQLKYSQTASETSVQSFDTILETT